MTQTEKDAVLGARIRQYLEAESTISLLESEINKATGYVRDFRERLQKPQISTSRPADEVQRVASELGDNLVALEAAVATKAELERCLERTGVPAFLTPQS